MPKHCIGGVYLECYAALLEWVRELAADGCKLPVVPFLPNGIPVTLFSNEMWHLSQHEALNCNGAYWYNLQIHENTKSPSGSDAILTLYVQALPLLEGVIPNATVLDALKWAVRVGIAEVTLWVGREIKGIQKQSVEKIKGNPEKLIWFLIRRPC